MMTTLAATGARSYAGHGRRRFWLQRTAYGFLLGASIALLEFAYYSPLVTAHGMFGADLLASLLVSFAGEGILLALAVAVLETRQAPRPVSAQKLGIAVVVAATAGVVFWQAFIHLVLREHFGFRVLRDYVNQPVDMTSIVLYHVWLMLFFGALATALYFSRQRNARTLASLRAAELARESTQGRLAETTLAAFRARVDPGLVLGRLKEIERLYETDSAAAGRFLEDFIVFLRRALADVRAAEASSSHSNHQSTVEVRPLQAKSHQEAT